MSELKPCPFCNGPNIVVIEREDKEHPDAVYSMAQCGDCLAEGPLSLDYIQAQEKWNTRAESPELAAMTADRDRARQANEANSAGYLACADQRQAAERQLADAGAIINRQHNQLQDVCVKRNDMESKLAAAIAERDAMVTEISVVQARLTAAQDACQRRDGVIEELIHGAGPTLPELGCTCTSCLVLVRDWIKTKLEG